MSSSTAKTFISAAIVVLGLAAVFGLSGFIERNRPVPREGMEDEDLIVQGAKLKGFSLGFEGLIADWYWMRSLQYLGDKMLKSKDDEINLNDLRPLNPRLLYPYLNTATDLDPRFMAAFSYGAVVLPAIDPQSAIDITEKGIANNPNEWRLYNYLGYIYWRLEEYDKAADVYEKGSKVADAQPFMQVMAAKLKTQGGSRDTAREMYRNMLDGANDEHARESVTRDLLRLDALDEIDAINPVLRAYQAQNNRCPASWGEIGRQLGTVKLSGNRPLNFDRAGNPFDPLGVPYVIVSQNGECRADINYELSKIPRE
jgi:tetratricopeptide (TPR) repeat protein